MMSYVKVEIRDDVGFIYLNRPNKRNSINVEFMDELMQAIDYLDGKVKGLICTSASEKFFCSGGDLGYFVTLDSAEKARSMSVKMHSVMNRFEDLDIPTLCVINGPAVGGGAEFILSFDIRYLSSDSYIQFKERDIGTTTGWGGTYRLVRLVGYSVALELLYSARRIYADEALRFGLVNRVYESEELQKCAFEFMKSVCSEHVELVKSIKELSKMSLRLGREEAMSLERELFGICWMLGKREEKMKKFLDKG